MSIQPHANEAYSEHLFRYARLECSCAVLELPASPQKEDGVPMACASSHMQIKLTMQKLTRISKREERRKDDNCAPVAFALHKAIRIRIYHQAIHASIG